MPARMLLFSSFCSLIKYAKPISFYVRKLLDDLSPSAHGSPHDRKSVRNNYPETKKDWKRQI